MVRDALSVWVQGQHLTSAAINSYRSSFQASPARFLVIEDFLVEGVAERLSEFLQSEAQFETEYGVSSAEDHKVDKDEWTRASDEHRFFRYGRLVGTPAEFQFSNNSLTYLKFRTTFQADDNLRRFFENVTGLELARSDDFGSHSMGVADFLKDHDDNNRNRRLAPVLYLSPDWKREYGGSLHIVDGEGRDSVVEPSFNSVVAFDTLAGTTHYVDPITEAAGEQKRVTIGGWYHNP